MYIPLQKMSYFLTRSDAYQKRSSLVHIFLNRVRYLNINQLMKSPKTKHKNSERINKVISNECFKFSNFTIFTDPLSVKGMKRKMCVWLRKCGTFFQEAMFCNMRWNL